MATKEGKPGQVKLEQLTPTEWERMQRMFRTMRRLELKILAMRQSEQ